MGAPTLTWHEVDYTLDNDGDIKEVVINPTPVNTSTNIIYYNTVQVAKPSKVICVVGKFTWGPADSEDSRASNIKFWLNSRNTTSSNPMAAGWRFLYGYIPFNKINRYTIVNPDNTKILSNMPLFKDFSEAIRQGDEDFTDIEDSQKRLITLNEFEPVNVDTNIAKENFFVYNTINSYTPYIFMTIIPSYQQGDGFVSGWTYRGSYIYR